MENPDSRFGSQYATRASDRNPSVSDITEMLSPVRHRRTLLTRAPRELTFSVNVVSNPGMNAFPEIRTPTCIGKRGSERAI